MRTKTLVTLAALGLAGATAANAQVYSVNAVGYINVTMATGFNLVANQLTAADPSVAAVLAGVPGGTLVYKYSPAAGYDINSFDADFDEWDNPSMTLNPGEGFWLRNPGEPFTVTFVGEVPQGTLTTPLAAGFNLVSSQVPQAGAVGTDLAMPVGGGDIVYTYSPASGYTISVFDADFDEWDPAEPTVAVGEGFWVRKAAAATWTRTFSVNP